MSEDFADAGRRVRAQWLLPLSMLLPKVLYKPAAVIPSPPVSPRVSLPPSRGIIPIICSDGRAASDRQHRLGLGTVTGAAPSRKKKEELEAEAEAA